MSFFDQLSAPEERPSPARVGDPWGGPPTGVVGGWVPWCIVLVHSDTAHAFVHGFEVFETGLLFQLVARFDPKAIEFDKIPKGPVVADTCPRIGVSFSDGRKAATPTTGMLAYRARRGVDPARAGRNQPVGRPSTTELSGLSDTVAIGADFRR